MHPSLTEKIQVMRNANNVLLLLVIFTACSPINRQNKIKHTFDAANQKLEDAYFEDAIVLYSKVLELDHEIVDAYMNRGVAYFETGHYALALADYNHVRQMKPEFHGILFNRINAYMEMNRMEMAATDIDFLKTIYPDTALIWNVEGLMFGKQKDYMRGKASFKIALAKDARNFDAAVNLGVMHFHLNEFDSAELALTKALKLHENAPEALNPLSLALLHQGKLDEADAVIDKAIALVRDQPYFLNNKGLIQIHKGKYELADSLITQSLKLDPTNQSALDNSRLLKEKQND